ncbi:type I polyketide synthase [Streptacidiphilus neutrinimicus]|uniref:type I polyketide synthase n=1 Tax=Streptacidiphilus neutrinimicus TaxID=105420 RepID=UPI0006944B44|nr:type I polyketide synthase [Streptacidiphilus neutrinimicus]
MDTVDAIAIVGMSCRFPGADGVDAFWRLLETNTDAITGIPRDRFDVDSCYAPDPGTPGRTVSRHGGFITGLHDFDAGFFGISPREARLMDPQQRVLLQVVWEAFEDAAIPPSSVAGSDAGVFVGQATAEYAEVGGAASVADVRAVAGSRLRAVTSGRVSQALDLRGPSLVLDTACSSSLVAVHAARQSLLTRECGLAVAAGVNAILSPADAVAYSQGGMLAPDGRCKFGDSGGDGFVRSEGVGAVLLKRLDDALADGDDVLAVLLGSAVTNDGNASGLLLQPSVPGQVSMLRNAWRSAGATADQVDYVEAHGTGTVVGDGVELRALTEALRTEGADGSAKGGPRRPDAPLLLGSVKTNIGHAESAAGIAGLIKAVLVLRHRLVPASLHLTRPRAELNTPDAVVAIPTENTPLRPRGERAVVGVSSFGLSGTNAHVVLGEFLPVPIGSAEATSVPTSSPADAKVEMKGDVGAGGDPELRLLVLSARSREALLTLASRYADRAAQADDSGLSALCRGAALGRDAHPYRLWAVARTPPEMAAVLRSLAAGDPCPDGGLGEAGFGEPRQAVFVFPGQGSQWRGMGRELLRSSAAFRETLRACDAAVQSELGWSVLARLSDDGDGSNQADVAVDVVQPVLWAVQVALAAHWRAMGVDPQVCLGHSMGEVAAACAAGALSVRDAARVICRRSRLMQRVAGRGAMLATELGGDEARELAARHGDTVCVAVENAPRSTVLAGDATTLAAIAEELELREVFCRTVKVNVASHSPVMDELREDLLAALAELEPRHAHTAMVSTVRCAPLTGAELDAGYWMDNLRRPVRFAETARQVGKEHETVFVEISPHPLLTQALREVQEHAGVPSAVVGVTGRRDGERLATVRALGEAYALGAPVDWSRWYGEDAGPRRVPLPHYTWDVQEFRVDPADPVPPVHPVHAPDAGAPVLSPRRYDRTVHLSRLGLDALGAGVTLRGQTAVPPAVHLSAVAEAARDLVGDGPVLLRDVRLAATALPLAHARTSSLAVAWEQDTDRTGPSRPGVLRFVLDTIGEDTGAGFAAVRAGTRAVSGTVLVGEAAREALALPELRRDDALTRCTQYVPADEFYRRLEARGYSVAPQLRAVRELWRREGEVVARLQAPAASEGAALESGLLAMLAGIPESSRHGGAGDAFLPVSFESVALVAPPTGEFWSMARFTLDADGQLARCDVRLSAIDGTVLADFHGVTLLRAPQAPAGPADAARTVPVHVLLPHTIPAPAMHTVTAGAASARSAEPTPVVLRRRTGTGGDDGVIRHAAAVLGTTPDRLDLRRPLRDLGLDSLMAVQLSRLLRRDFGVELSTSRLLGDETAAGLAKHLERGAPVHS